MNLCLFRFLVSFIIVTFANYYDRNYIFIMRMLSNADLAQLLDKDIFHKISEAADSLHLETYVVGGYVRDLFLERPSNDIDVVVVGSGIEVAKAFRSRGPSRSCAPLLRGTSRSAAPAPWTSWPA